jgi:peptidoglycan/xylan/chitin deacetylase (PgdA/CDA1 family)
VITCGAANRPAIALTFETSFGAGAVAAIVDSLRRHSAVATWFWSGEWAKRHPELARQIVRAGHQVELHGHTHQHLRELTPAEVRRDLERAGAAVRVFTGRKPRYLRPPFGSFNRAALATAAELGYRVALWSVDSLDWQNPGVGEIANRVMRGVRPGAIVLMHGTADQAPGALEEIIPGVRNAGYSLVTLDELLRDRLDPGPTP